MSMFLVLAALVASPVQECSVDDAFSGPAAGESIALATATGRSLLVSASPSPLTRDLASRTFTTPPSVDLDTPVRAYELVIRIASAPEPGGMGTAGVLVPADTVLAVPWALDAECAATRFQDETWVTEGTEVVVRADYVRLHEGRRVIDVIGPLNGYPHATSLPSELGSVTSSADWLSPSDLYFLLTSAPDPTSGAPRRDQLRRFENHYRGGSPDLLRRFPGPEMLEWARRWASNGNAF